MLHKKSEKGQALVLIAFAAVGLFAFTALSVDGGRVFSDRRHAQNAADTAALAAALARVRAQSDPDGAAVASGEARALSNGYPNDPASTVEVKICDDPSLDLSKDCQGLPGNAVLSDYIQVKITSYVRTTFARIIGWQQVKNVVTAVSRAKLGGLEPLFDGSALVALAPTGTNTVGGNGNITLDINHSGIFDNSKDNCAMGVVGNGTYTVDTAYSVVGTLCQNGNNSLNGPIQGTAQLPYPPTDLAIPDPSITCSGNGSTTADDPINQPGKYTVHPGNFPSLTLNNGNYTFMAGSYCFHGNVSINGNTDVTANYVDILMTAGDFQINGNSSFNCDFMLVYINGGSGMHFNGNGSNTCTNVTFFAKTGSVTWNGNVANTFTAPTSGFHQEYANLLIYMPYGNSENLQINGNAGNTLTGSIIAVSSNVTIAGNSGTTGFNSSVTGYTVTLAGNSNTTINYHPENQVNRPKPSSIGLTK